MPREHKVLFFYPSIYSTIMHSLHNALRSFFTAPELEGIRIEPLAGEASLREYFRVRSPDGTWILCVDKDYRSHPTAQYPFLVVQQLFTGCSVPVPAVIGSDKKQGVFLLEDCGDLLLQNALQQETTDPAALYRQAVDIMTAIQSIKGSGSKMPFNRAFDEEKLMFEFLFFLDNASPHVSQNSFFEKNSAVLRNEFLSITKRLLRTEHFVLNHRDYHSRNILVTPAGPVIIDFQDARMGLPQYDAVSLLRDSYVRLDDDFVTVMQQHHYNQLQARNLTGMSCDEYLYLFDLMAFQRNIKALGTFFNQTFNLGKKEFEQYIAPTLAYLPRYIERQPELARSGELVLNILGKFKP